MYQYKSQILVDVVTIFGFTHIIQELQNSLRTFILGKYLRGIHGLNWQNTCNLSYKPFTNVLLVNHDNLNSSKHAKECLTDLCLPVS